MTYGESWIHPNHPEPFDDADGLVTWDGACVDDGPNSYAVLSNGWKPYFSGHSACVIALDARSCPGAPTSCGTRVSYGAAWLAPAGHPARYDDVGGRLVSDRVCRSDGAEGYVALSNGWQPHFANKQCAVSLRYTQCGGLYQNPVVPTDCPDPGVWKQGDTYTMACTGGDGGGLYVLRTSKDLVHWKTAGHVFPSGSGPKWANGSFWAPEIHEVGGQFVAYFSARSTDGVLSIGAATGPTPLGPFKDLGKPLVHDASMGMIDVSEFEDAAGKPYLVWKADGNAQQKPTPIYGQALGPDGTSLTGARVTLLTNDLGWEGPLIEAPWVISRGGYYYLFYSANAYYNGTYAVGVARATSPLGPYTKHGAPILTTNLGWVGPGHCSVVVGPSGQDMMVYHAWRAGAVGGNNGRVVLVDGLEWSGGWPSVPAAPSSGSRPMP
ncbi:MAG: family 43 glycosylhydrolase [Polyangiaceae bacterium]|nr:family 43 glycosylhydrolase [Polyangiaceae bacterium]